MPANGDIRLLTAAMPGFSVTITKMAVLIRTLTPVEINRAGEGQADQTAAENVQKEGDVKPGAWQSSSNNSNSQLRRLG